MVVLVAMLLVFVATCPESVVMLFSVVRILPERDCMVPERAFCALESVK